MCEYGAPDGTVRVARFKLARPHGAHKLSLWTYGGSITTTAVQASPVESWLRGAATAELITHLLPTQSPNVEFGSEGRRVADRREPEGVLNPPCETRHRAGVPDGASTLAAKKGSVKHTRGCTFETREKSRFPGGDRRAGEWIVP